MPDTAQTSPPPAEAHETWGEIVRRESGVDPESLRALPTAHLEPGVVFTEMHARLDHSAAIMDRYSPDRMQFLARDLSVVLEASLADGKLDALLVATDDGLVVAESHRMEQGEILAAISTLCENIASRLQREGVLTEIEEMSIRGAHGEQIIVRYFPGDGNRYFLLGFSRRLVPYRRAMTVTLRKCAGLLNNHFPGENPGPATPNLEEQEPT